MSAVIEAPQIIAIFGANGNISSNVLSHIDKSMTAHEHVDKYISNFKIRIVTRNPELLLSMGYNFAHEVVRGSIDDVHLLGELLKDVSRAFFCLPQEFSSADMVRVSNLFADGAKAAGVQVIVRISSYGIDSSSATTCSQGTLGGAHIAGEQYMKKNGLILTSIRPTSFFSNFLKYDAPSIRAVGSFYSPLGDSAAVNWISCDDISAVVACALLNTSLDGKVLDVTGSEKNTLSAEAMRQLIQLKTGKMVSYIELPLPDSPEMNGLWTFLRAGGFCHHTKTFEEVTGRQPTEFSAFLSTILDKL